MDPLKLLEQWHNAVRILHHAHTRAAVVFDRRSRLLGVPVIILSTAVGTSLFASTGEAHGLKITAGLLSLGAAVLSSLQTALKYPEIAARHKAAAQKYGKLRREIEVQLALKIVEQPKFALALDKFEHEMDTLEDQSPNIPQNIYDRSAALEMGHPQPAEQR